MKEDNWVTVKEFMAHYKLPRALAYTVIHAKNFPMLRVGKEAIRINLSKTDEFFKKEYNN